MQTPEERYATHRKCVLALRALRIRRRRCVDCAVRLRPDERRQRCTPCALRNNVGVRACYARKKQASVRV